MTINYKPIGIINTPHKTKEGMPIQTKGAKGIKGQIILKEEFTAGLNDLEGFSHIIFINQLDLNCKQGLFLIIQKEEFFQPEHQEGQTLSEYRLSDY